MSVDAWCPNCRQHVSPITVTSSRGSGLSLVGGLGGFALTAFALWLGAGAIHWATGWQPPSAGSGLFSLATGAAIAQRVSQANRQTVCPICRTENWQVGHSERNEGSA